MCGRLQKEPSEDNPSLSSSLVRYIKSRKLLLHASNSLETFLSFFVQFWLAGLFPTTLVLFYTCSLSCLIPGKSVPYDACSCDLVPCSAQFLLCMFPALDVPCSACSLLCMFTALHVPCGMFPARHVHVPSECSLLCMFPALHVPCSSCSMLNLFPAMLVVS
jgi:hypothetical protein